ncbi:hypothetical protein [Amycolatopsis granulosa]|uniref:hypothetical protein n=1 Tax=Amycolatopsis granulosa TaxID=185684 RepID=UPI0014245E00|nr:hypothetical protein [Amycolatopsis granulosa]NIH87376.1 hypothetical protein [Amycolatopsis granulosa]
MQAETSWLPPWSTDPATFAAWGQWAGALGSMAAVIVALALAAVDGRRRRRELADRQAAQARTVTCTVTRSIGQDGDRDELSVVVHNHGQLPVTDVYLRDVRMHFGDTTLQDWDFAAPRQRDEGRAYPLDTVIGPQDHSSSPRLIFRDEPAEGAPPGRGEATTRFAFLDASGLCWERINNGPPRRIYTRQEKNRIERRAFRRLIVNVTVVCLLIGIGVGTLTATLDINFVSSLLLDLTVWAGAAYVIVRKVDGKPLLPVRPGK